MWHRAVRVLSFCVAALAIFACVSNACAGISVPGFPNDPTLHAMAASADGTIAVGYRESDPTNEAILWRPQSGVLPIKDYLVSHNVAGLDGWKLTSATHISPDGEMFCGWALDPTGEESPWLAESLGADVNLDWRVNIFDVNVISSNWGGSTGAGDANGDGKVNIFDINAVSASWGRSGTFNSVMTELPPPLNNGVETAPEPASIGIWAVLAGAAGIFVRWRRRAR
jgi:hypothetical protein